MKPIPKEVYVELSKRQKDMVDSGKIPLNNISKRCFVVEFDNEVEAQNVVGILERFCISWQVVEEF